MVDQADKKSQYDITPFEFGAWNGSISAFTPTRWLGTKLSGGTPVNESACIVGFDRAGFVALPGC